MGLVKYIREEIQVIRERDPAIKSNWEVFLYPSFKVILSFPLLTLKGQISCFPAGSQEDGD